MVFNKNEMTHKSKVLECEPGCSHHDEKSNIEVKSDIIEIFGFLHNVELEIFRMLS